jgi:hypothetical protein
VIRSDALQAPGLQCVVLDENITALLHGSKPTLSACACHDTAARGRGDGDKGHRPGEAESAASRRRLVRRDGVDVQVHLPQACVLRGI